MTKGRESQQQSDRRKNDRSTHPYQHPRPAGPVIRARLRSTLRRPTGRTRRTAARTRPRRFTGSTA